MKENRINIIEILKECPEGTKLWSPLFGDVFLLSMGSLIAVKTQKGDIVMFNRYGIFVNNYEECGAECLLFPYKEYRDWNKFKPKQSKFDPKTLKPFDKVLVRDKDSEKWSCGIFSHKVIDDDVWGYNVGEFIYTMCIPYNDDTKHLVGTNEEAPEYYRYWED